MLLNLDHADRMLICACLKTLTIPQAKTLIEKLTEVEGLNDQAYIKAARDLWETDELEIDDHPRVSLGGDAGAWVSAWVWVQDAEAGLEDD